MGKRNTKDLNQQKSTKINIFNDPYEELSSIHQHSVDLRVEGMKYRDIAKEIGGVKEQTVRIWFMKGGICYEAFKFKKKIRNQDRKQLFKKIDEQLKDIAVDAVNVLKNAVRKGNWKAAVKALEMAGFEPVIKIEDKTPQRSGTLELLKKILIKDKNADSKHIQNKQSAGSSNT